MALLNTNNKKLSRALRRKLDDDGALLKVCKDIVAHITDDNGNEDNDHSGTGTNDQVGWIGCWVNKPTSECGRKT